MMFEKKITQFEKEVLLQQKSSSSKVSLKNFLSFKKKCIANGFKKVSWVWKIEFNESKNALYNLKSCQRVTAFLIKKAQISIHAFQFI